MDPGVPRIVWAGPTSVRVFRGSGIALNGFRYAGAYSRHDGPIVPWSRRETHVFEYSANLAGYSDPALTTTRPSLWVALFAARAAGAAGAELRFSPFLEIEAYDNATGVAQIAAYAGALEAQFFRDAEALIVTRNHTHVFETVRVRDNSATSVTLPEGLQLLAGDRLLLAPGAAVDFKYMHTLLLDRSPTVGRGFEWRNFLQLGRRTSSYHGSVCGDFTSTAWASCSLRGVVAPLATGAIVSGQAFNPGTTATGPVLRLSHDSANHVIASFGLDRSAVAGSGASSTTVVAIDAAQQTWGAVSAPGITGRLTLFGWSEE